MCKKQTTPIAFETANAPSSFRLLTHNESRQYVRRLALKIKETMTHLDLNSSHSLHFAPTPECSASATNSQSLQ
jgi:hypothetical protein